MGKNLKYVEFDRKKDKYLSACGFAYEIEIPGIIRNSWNNITLGKSDINHVFIEEHGRRIKFIFRSFLVLPIKNNAKVISVIFLGSSFPLSFSKRSINILKAFSHAIGETLLIINECPDTRKNILSDIEFKNAKNYLSLKERHLNIWLLETINKGMGKGGKNVKRIDLERLKKWA